jgi:hypothetical protein
MSYQLFWRSPALPFVQKQTTIVVPAGALISNAASIRFTGKGATNYGKVQQENLMNLLENFAGSTAPDFPTVGQIWFDSTNSILKVCVATAPSTVAWRSVSSMQIGNVGEAPPSPAAVGDQWFSRTGSASGVLYVYTGLGRYPAASWDATASGYFPNASVNKLGIKLNTTTFAGAVGSNYGEAFIHGFTGSTPADVDGSILVSTVPTTVPKGALLTSNQVTNGYIVWDTTASMTASGGGGSYFVVRQLGDGRWQYDNNVYWTDFTPVLGQRVLGIITVAQQDLNATIGISSATMWADSRELTALTQVPSTLAGGAIGGWNQVWPQIDVSAGRDEYEYVYSLVASLIGDALAFGGSDSIGKAIQDLTDFRTLDASLQRAWLSITTNDQNVLRSTDNLNLLKVEPNSQDWDRLLAAAKYAISRLELPPAMSDDISSLPFVADGRPAPASLYALPTTNVRYPSADRQVNRRPGIVTTLRQYQESINVLKAAIQNRYMLKGIMGSTGTNTAFNSGVAVIQQATFSNTTSFTSTPLTHGLLYRFNFDSPELQKFFFSGEAIEVVLLHTPSGSPTAADTNLKTLIDANGRIRLTADNTYIMSRSSTPALSRAPLGLGYTSLAANTTLVSITSGNATMTVRAGIISGGVALYVDISTTTGTTGTFSSVWNYISDNETYLPGPVRVYPAPLTYTGTDKQGSGNFV